MIQFDNEEQEYFALPNLAAWQMTFDMKLLLLLFTMLLAHPAFGQTTCTPKLDGGFSCYNYETGSYSEATPKLDGGYSIYDYGSGTYKEVTPKLDGGFSIYDYETGAYSEASPKLGGGFSIYDYSSGSHSEVTPRLDGGFDIWDYDFSEEGGTDFDDDDELTIDDY